MARTKMSEVEAHLERVNEYLPEDSKMKIHSAYGGYKLEAKQGSVDMSNGYVPAKAMATIVDTIWRLRFNGMLNEVEEVETKDVVNTTLSVD